MQPHVVPCAEDVVHLLAMGFRLQPMFVDERGRARRYRVWSPINVSGLRTFVYGDWMDAEDVRELAARNGKEHGWCDAS